MSNRKSYDVGIFGDTKDNLGDFSSMFYLSLLLSQSCEQYDEVKEEYERALLGNDTTLITQKEMELSICQSTLSLTAKMLESYNEINS
jgi:hypothetical protein|tara:strand:- start:310 stop:573 length:264 start_codon:yes stop_codon:yes gene_type:complete